MEASFVGIGILGLICLFVLGLLVVGLLVLVAVRLTSKSDGQKQRAALLQRLAIGSLVVGGGLVLLMVVGTVVFLFGGVGIGPVEILLIFGVLPLLVLPAIVVLVVLAARQSPATPAAAATGSRALPLSSDDDRQTIIARLTQRFCPQCRAPLAGDAPEGLCPACLMAGGLASDFAHEPVNGLAATTPPSGSQPPATGQWVDLQQHFPELEILELLGQGGMGSVYKVRQKSLDRLAALKVIPPEAAKDPAFAERFAREARALARLNHSNIVTVYHFGQTGDVFYLLMEYVDGVNLRHAMRAQRLAPQEALAIVPQICDALQYAHDQGVVHRDIKPENVLLDRGGRVKIADFGLAKLLGKGPDDFTLTRTQQVMGTPRYMAPEQIDRPSAVDHRADIYSLGVVIYEMLTGELPMGRFAMPSEKVAVDVRIDQVVLRALEREPERRYQRASQVKTELASAGSWPPAAAAVAASPFADAPAAAATQANHAERPQWQTPAPATKSDGSARGGDHRLPEVLGVAIGMVMGVLIITGGLAAAIYGMTQHYGFSSPWWGWVGGGFGCIVGGFGSLAGSYNTYRQMAGAEDLMRSPNVTWFDWSMRGYFLFGILLIVAGLGRFAAAPRDMQSFYGLMLVGGIATFQAALFLVYRMLARAGGPRPHQPPAPQPQPQPADPAREAIRRRVAGPAIGLMIAGSIGLMMAMAAPVVALSSVDQVTPAQPSAPPGAQTAVSPDEFNRLLAGLKRESFDEGKLSFIRAWCVHRSFTSDQVHELLREFSFDRDRGKAAIALYPHVTDPENFFMVLDAFAFDSERSAVRDALTRPTASPTMTLAPVWPAIPLTIGLALSIATIAGGWQMRQLKSYGLAMTAAALALFPCSIGWIIGMPMGVWALMVLNDQKVREAFES